MSGGVGRRLRVLAWAVAAAGPAWSAPPACPDAVGWPAWRAIGAHTWWLPSSRGEPDAGNGGRTAQLLLARDGARLWLVGAGATPADGRVLACTIRALTGRRVTDLVVTRAAPELAMGSVAFDGARRWALADVAAQMQNRCGACQSRLREQIGEAGGSLLPGSIRVPDHTLTLAEGSVGRLGPFDTLALRRRAGEGVLVLRHRRDRVVIAQGLLWAGDVPDLRASAEADLAQAWRRLLAWGGADGRTVWLGEQGGLASPADVEDHLAYAQGLGDAIARALARGEAWGERPLEGPSLPPQADARRHALNAQHRWLERESAWLR